MAPPFGITFTSTILRQLILPHSNTSAKTAQVAPSILAPAKDILSAKYSTRSRKLQKKTYHESTRRDALEIRRYWWQTTAPLHKHWAGLLSIRHCSRLSKAPGSGTAIQPRVTYDLAVVLIDIIQSSRLCLPFSRVLISKEIGAEGSAL